MEIEIPVYKLTNLELIAKIKYNNPHPSSDILKTLYSQYVRLRDIKPNINAKRFYELFNIVTPNAYTTLLTIPTKFQYYDTLFECKMSVEQKEGCYKIIWVKNSEIFQTGSDPTDCFENNIKTGRFVKLKDCI